MMEPTIRVFASRLVLWALVTLGIVAFIWRGKSTRISERSLNASQSETLAKMDRPLVFQGQFNDTLILFVDYSCRYCAALYPELVRPDAPYGLVVIHIADRRSPLFQAAVAAECARNLRRFYSFSYGLFAKRDSVGRIPFESFAAQAGVRDLAGFSQCVENRIPYRIVEEDMRLALMLGIEGTPAAVLHGKLYQGPASILGLVAPLFRARP